MIDTRIFIIIKVKISEFINLIFRTDWSEVKENKFLISIWRLLGVYIF